VLFEDGFTGKAVCAGRAVDHSKNSGDFSEILIKNQLSLRMESDSLSNTSFIYP